MANREKVVRHGSQQLTFEDYIAVKATERLFNKLRKEYARCVPKLNTKEEFMQRYGYTPTAIEAKQNRQIIQNELTKKTKLYLSSIWDKASSDPILNINVKNGKTIQFCEIDLYYTILEITPEIAEIDSDYLQIIRTEIEKAIEQQGVDPTKICFDTRTRDKMMEIDRKTGMGRRQVGIEAGTTTQVTSKSTEESTYTDEFLYEMQLRERRRELVCKQVVGSITLEEEQELEKLFAIFDEIRDKKFKAMNMEGAGTELRMSEIDGVTAEIKRDLIPKQEQQYSTDN